MEGESISLSVLSFFYPCNVYVTPFLLIVHSVLPALASVALKLTSPDKTAFFTFQTKVKS